MSCIQITLCQFRPSICISRDTLSPRRPSKLCFLPIHSNKLARTSLKLTAGVSKYSKRSPVLKYKAPVCLFGGTGKSGSGSEGSEWNPLQEAMESVKNKSIEDVLREQIAKQEYAVENGGSGGKPPRGSGGGGRGRGRGWDNSDGSEDGRLNETLQVILATLGFLLVYIYTIHGEEILLLARDYFKYLCTGTRTVRLRKTMEWWAQRWRGSKKRRTQNEDEDDDEDEYAYQ